MKFKKSILIFLLAVIITTGCQKEDTKNIPGEDSTSNKKILYKMKIDELPYINETFLSYSFNDTIGNKVVYMIDSTNKCIFYQLEKSDSLSVLQISSDCAYSVKNNHITIDLAVNKTYINESSHTTTNSTDKLVIEGTFNIQLSRLDLIIGNNEYELINGTYQKLIDRNLEYALYDPETHIFYDLDGISLYELDYSDGNVTGDYSGKKVQINLSDYDIQSGYTEYELWSTED